MTLQLTPEDITKTGPEEGGRFGTGLAVVDLNRDGVDDLVVSVPTLNSSMLDYRGGVYVYYGGAGGGVGSGDSLGGLQTTFIYVPVGSNGDGSWTNLGTTLLGEDIDGDGFKDLIIGSHLACNIESLCNLQQQQQRGLVSVFFSSTWSKRPQLDKVSISSADWKRYGDGPSSWFGYHVNYVVSGTSRYLLVGAPYTSKPNVAGLGTLYAFTINGNSISTIPSWSITGTQKFDKVGMHVSVGVQGSEVMLAISFPSRNVTSGAQDYWQAGGVVILPLDTISPGSYDLDFYSREGAFLEGTEMFGRLGYYTTWNPVTNDFWISQPFANNERGRIYNFGNTIPVYGSLTFVEPNSTNCYEYTAQPLSARYGSGIFFPKIYSRPSSPVIVPTVVSAPRDSQFGNEMGGSLVLFW
eukprot:TRINITY_DN1255_c0_g3_i5.p1 TRINITY_DN1255_c0_g3~~TRINITY_DN1255_c0_g3_i5.p1  ORF type:complete len:468 (+),score=103.97 TRINITY_DN1255_c0_g3_i5:177-1406(+)